MVVRVYGQGRSQDTQTLEFSLSELGLGSQPALFTIMYVGHELSGPPKVGVAIKGERWGGGILGVMKLVCLDCGGAQWNAHKQYNCTEGNTPK